MTVYSVMKKDEVYEKVRVGDPSRMRAVKARTPGTKDSRSLRRGGGGPEWFDDLSVYSAPSNPFQLECLKGVRFNCTKTDDV